MTICLKMHSERIPRSDSTVFDPEPFGSELKAELLRPKGARRSLAAGSFNLRQQEKKTVK